MLVNIQHHITSKFHAHM